jgi:AMP nucleosidase
MCSTCPTWPPWTTAFANGTYVPKPGEPSRWPVHRAAGGLLAAPAAPLHRHGAEHFQNFVLFTNYQFYIDEFVRLGRAAMQDPHSEYSPSSNPATW